MGVSLITTGSFSKTEQYLKSMQKLNLRKVIDPIARAGVAALSAATPKDTGLTSYSWNYEIVEERGYLTIYWTNDDVENGFHVAVMLQYGHGTGTGGYVQGRDYINPTMRPIFDKIADEVWRVVNSA